MSTKFRHSAHTQFPSGRRFTVAGVQVGNEMHFAISTCRPGDNFDRKYGREQAERRAKNEPDVIHKAILRPEDEAKINRFFNHLAGLLIYAQESKCELRKKIAKNLRKEKTTA